MRKYYVYIMLVRTNTVLSKLIHKIKNDAYTHASIALDKDLDKLYSFGRRKVYNPFYGCFVEEKIDDGLYKIYNTSPCKVLEIEVTQEQYNKANEVINNFREGNYKYNYIGLVYNLINKETINNRFLCSEFVYHVLKESHIVDLNIPRNLVRPIDLLNLKSRVVYQGHIRHLNKPILPNNRLLQSIAD